MDEQMRPARSHPWDPGSGCHSGHMGLRKNLLAMVGCREGPACGDEVHAPKAALSPPQLGD